MLVVEKEPTSQICPNRYISELILIKGCRNLP
jgi:hypothetical protein